MYKFHRKKFNRNRNKEKVSLEALNYNLSNQKFLLKKEWLIQNVEFKLKMIDLELSELYNRTVMQKVEHRIKKADSIARKLVKKGYKVSFENAAVRLNDIVGIRVVCLYSDDVYKIAELLKKQKDFTLIKEKDYIKNPKKSGYQSVHLIVGVPVTYRDKTQEIRVEVQIRSFAMDYWAELDTQMCYKKNTAQILHVERETKSYSDLIAEVDNKMLELRRQIEDM